MAPTLSQISLILAGRNLLSFFFSIIVRPKDRLIWISESSANSLRLTI